MNKNGIIVLHRQRIGQRAIARKLGISRNTVAKYVHEYETLIKELNEAPSPEKANILKEKINRKPKYDSRNRKKSKYNSDMDRRIDELLKFDETKNKVLGPNKQNLTASGIHQILVREGFDIGLIVISTHVREKKEWLKECFIKQTYEYGERCEFDFGEVKLAINGKGHVFYIAVFSAPRSNYIYAYLYRNQKMEVVLDSHINFIKHCDGVYKEIVYDNMKNVVKRFIGRNEKELTDEIIKLSTYYGFIVNLTNTYSPNEKGHVENSVKQVVKKVFAKRYQFNSYEEAKEYLESEMIEMNKNKRNEFNEEKAHLLKANPPYEIGVCRTHKVDSYSFIRLDNNYYSVPEYLVDKEVVSKAYLDDVYIYAHNEFVCAHKKRDGYNEYSIDINHYLSILSRKPGALKRSLAFKQAPATLQSIYRKYFTTNPKEFIGIIKLIGDVGYDAVLNAIDELKGNMLNKAINYETIIQIVYKKDLKVAEDISNKSFLNIQMDEQETIEKHSKLQLLELAKIVNLIN